jgi:outer membrane receptor for ferrienterochelin and colicins
LRIILIFIFFGVAFLFGKQFQFLDSQTKLPVKSVVVTSENGEVIESDKDGLININENYSGKLTVTHVSYYPHEYTMMELKKFKSKVVTIVLEPRSYMTPEIVSTANFSPTSSVNSLYNVDIISIEIIEAQKAPTLREILINQANIRVSDDPALGSGISINGLSGQNVQILIDGVPMIGEEDVIDTEDLYEFEIPDYHNLDITLTKGFWKSKFL